MMVSGTKAPSEDSLLASPVMGRDIHVRNMRKNSSCFNRDWFMFNGQWEVKSRLLIIGYWLLRIMVNGQWSMVNEKLKWKLIRFAHGS
jgi:hypothetical protein